MKKLTILIVDDDPEIVALVSEIAGEFPVLEVISATRYEMAQNILEGEGPIDIGVFDLNMGQKGDGFQLLEILNRRFPDAVSCILTGYGNKGTLISAIRSGVLDFIEKPFSPEILRKALGRLIESRLNARNEQENLQMYLESVDLMKQGKILTPLPADCGKTKISHLGKALMQLGSVLERRFEELYLLSLCNGEVNSGLIVDDVLDKVYDSFRDIIPYNRIGMALLDEDTDTLRAIWARADYPQVHLGKGFSAKIEGSSLAPILESGKPRYLNDLPKYLEEHPGSASTALMLREGIQSSLTCPLIAGGGPVGFLFFSSTAKDTYNEYHSGIFLQIAGHLSNIIEKSRIYEKLVRLNFQKNFFIGMAAHDLKNPLTAIMGAARRLGRMPASDEAGRSTLLKKIESCAHEMSILIEDFLSISSIEKNQGLLLNKEETDLSDLVQSVIRTMSLIAERKGITIASDEEESLPAMRLDPTRIRQVLSNLLSNAIKYSPRDSTVRLCGIREDKCLLITVEDEGPGIPPEEQKDIFTAFRKGNARPTAGESSSGLGLAIVKEIIRAHGGTVHVRSTPGEGSVFEVRLPLSLQVPGKKGA